MTSPKEVLAREWTRSPQPAGLARRKGGTQMATHSTAISASAEGIDTAKGTIALLGRFFFALIFILSAPGHFSEQKIGDAVSMGVPLASLAVPVSGVISLLGGVSILLGYRAKIGASLIVLFLIPVTLMMHRFWGVADPMTAQIQMIHFMKNVSMLGGALLISQLGAGPLSLDVRRRR
jgi:putative oxidoreductase